MSRKDDTEGTVPFETMSYLRQSSNDEPTTQVSPKLEAGLPKSGASMFCNLLGGAALLGALFLLFATDDDYGQLRWVSALYVGLSGGFLICLGSAIQYLYDIRNSIVDRQENLDA